MRYYSRPKYKLYFYNIMNTVKFKEYFCIAQERMLQLRI